MDLGWKQFAAIYDPISIASIDGTDVQPHDNAVVRALNSTYIPNRKLKGNPANTIFVGRLHPNVTNTELKEIFSEYGDIISCVVVTDIITGISRQYGFVEFAKAHHAEKAFKYGHKRIVKGAEILVEYEVGRTMRGWRPRSLGGGFGGFRESGQLRFGCRDRPWEKPIHLIKQSSQFERRKTTSATQFHSRSRQK